MPDLVEAFLEGCRAADAEDPGRPVPSPSSVADCTRRNAYKNAGVDVTDFPDGESRIARITGKASEEAILAQVEAAGIGRVKIRREHYPTDEAYEHAKELTPEELARIGMPSGQIDNMLECQGYWADRGLVVLEIKRKGIFRYLDVVRSGVLEGAPDDYTQAQLYIAAKDCQSCLYAAVNLDRSALTTLTTGRYGNAHWRERGRPHGIYMEFVPRADGATASSIERAAFQRTHLANPNPDAVPRDHNPDGASCKLCAPQGSDRPCWKCDWCQYKTRCLGAG